MPIATGCSCSIRYPHSSFVISSCLCALVHSFSASVSARFVVDLRPYSYSPEELELLSSSCRAAISCVSSCSWSRSASPLPQNPTHKHPHRQGCVFTSAYSQVRIHTPIFSATCSWNQL
jgi:hypothetical protein